jgi:hypothetical protein
MKELTIEQKKEILLKDKIVKLISKKTAKQMGYSEYINYRGNALGKVVTVICNCDLGFCVKEFDYVLDYKLIEK